MQVFNVIRTRLNNGNLNVSSWTEHKNINYKDRLYIYHAQERLIKTKDLHVSIVFFRVTLHLILSRYDEVL